jgi:hypothetical protein
MEQTALVREESGASPTSLVETVQRALTRLLPSNTLTKFDYIIGGALLLVCWVSFWHNDIWVTGRYSLSFLFGKPLEFYDNIKELKWSANYPATIYVAFALWLYPLKLFGLVKSASSLPLYAAYWLKTLTTLLYALSGLLFYKITQIYGRNKEWGRYAAILWLTMPLAMFSEFVFSQYDIFHVALALAGLLLFLRGQSVAASACFGIAITFKYFPIFAFLPLLLLFEKRLTKIFVCLATLSVPTLLVRAPYSRSPAFKATVGDFQALDRIYASFLGIDATRRVFYLFAAFAVLCFIVYIADVTKERLPFVAAYVYLVGSILPFLFILWHPQWTICFAPAITLTTVLDKRSVRFLLLDLAGMLFFTAFVSLAFPDNVDAGMFRGTLFGIDFRDSYKMARLFTQFGDHSTDVFLSAFWAYLVVQLVMKFKLATIQAPVEQHIFHVNYSNVRNRFYVGLLIFLLPASYAIYKDHRNTIARLRNEPRAKISSESILNEASGNNYGELINGRSFEQSFLAPKDGYLTEIDLFLATFARHDSGLLVLKIFDVNNRELLTSETSIDSIQDSSWVEFRFPPPKVTKGTRYRISLTSPTGQNGNAITWWGSEQDTYRDGNSIVDGVSKPTDFAFRVKFSQ